MISMLRRTFLIFALTFGTAFAANIPFEQANFDQLIKQGKPVVLHFHADWCPVCRTQQSVLDELMPQAEFKDLTVYRVNFDKEKSVLRKYKVRNQSTFIVFKNGKEVARSTGETDSVNIAELLKKAL
jgi:thiol-disulfide isomerase/thioredoxin